MEKFDFYKDDNIISWLAASIFTDEHYGDALSDDELNYRKQLQKDYAYEIEFVKLMIKDNPNFDVLSDKDKINFIANLLFSLREKRDNGKINNNEKIR